MAHRGDTPGLKAGLYGRASSDPKKRGRSIRDQFADDELECRDRDWVIVEHYEDRDLSASRKARKPRPDYERLVADAESGALDVIVYAERSRVSRDMEVSMRLRNLCDRTGVLLCYDGRVYDMAVQSDRKEFTRDALASEEEAESMIHRAARTARLNAGRGAPHGKAPFGFMRKYDPLDGHLLGQFEHPDFGPVVLDLFKRADAGETFVTLQAILSRYVPKADRYGLRYILKNRAYIGQRVHNKEYVKATWDGFIPEDLFWRVQAIVDDPARRTQKDTRAKYLLSGIATCSRCLAAEARWPTLTRRHPVEKTGAAERYCCRVGHMGISRVVLDAFVEEGLMRWLASAAAEVAFMPADPDDTEAEKCRLTLDALQAQLDEGRQLAGQLNEDGIPRLSILSLAQLEHTLLPQIARVQTRLHALLAAGDPLVDSLLRVSPEAREHAWSKMTMPQQRSVVRRAVNVTLNPASGRGVRTLEEGRVTLVYLGGEGFVPRPWYGRDA